MLFRKNHFSMRLTHKLMFFMATLFFYAISGNVAGQTVSDSGEKQNIVIRFRHDVIGSPIVFKERTRSMTASTPPAFTKITLEKEPSSFKKGNVWMG